MTPSRLRPLLVLASCAGAIATAAVPCPAWAEPRLVQVGDVDGDLASEVLVVTDKTVTLLDGPQLARVLWEVRGETAGLVFAMAGDVDGDGLADLAVGNPGVGALAVGRVSVFFGQREVGAPRTQTILGEEPGDGFGSGVAGLDLDGDGVSELVISSPGRSAPGGYGWLGIHRGFRSDGVNLGGLDDLASDGFWGLWQLGARVERVFDGDHDGYGDVLISDYLPAVGAQTAAHGGAWLVGYGISGLKLTPVGAPDQEPTRLVGLGDVDGDDGAELVWPWPGVLSTDEYAIDEIAIAPAGDFNGDFVADVLINTPGESRLWLGAANDQAPKQAWVGTAAYAVGDVDADGYADLGILPHVDPLDIEIIHGGPELLGEVALVLRPADDLTPPAIPLMTLEGGPDLDLDGFEGDLAIGLPEMDAYHPWLGGPMEDSGAVLLLSQTTRPSAPEAMIVLALPIWPVVAGAHFGAALSAGSFRRGEVLVVGAPGLDARHVDDGFFWSGNYLQVRANLGSFGGPHAHARLGASVSLFGDLDGDGLGDLAVAAPGFSADTSRPDAGRVSIHHAMSDGRPEREPRFVIDGQQAGMGLGVLSVAGDVDGDGRAELAIGAPNLGEVQLVRLPATGPKLSLTRLGDPSRPTSPRGFGQTLAAGDFNGDGLADLAVGAPQDARIEVYFGSDEGPPVTNERRQTLVLAGGGQEMTLAAGDFDGDGVSELVAGRSDASGVYAHEGRVEVFRGTHAGLAPAPAMDFSGGRAEARFGLAVVAFDRNLDGFCDLAFGLLGSDGRPLIALAFGNDGAHGRGVRAHVEGANGRTGPWTDTSLRDLITVRLEPGGPSPGQRGVEASLTAVGSDAPTRSNSNVGPSAVPIGVRIAQLVPATAYRFRARATWPVAEAPLQPSSRWVHPYPGLPPGVDFRTRRNAAPVALGDTFRVKSGTNRIPLSWLFDNDYDVDYDSLTLAAFSPPSAGRLEREGDVLIFEPPDGTPVELHFSYRLRDSFGLESRPAEVTLAVTDCELMTCRDGVVNGNLALPEGKVAGFSCRVRYDVEPPSLECPTGVDGELVLGSRTCGP